MELFVPLFHLHPFVSPTTGAFTGHWLGHTAVVTYFHSPTDCILISPSAVIYQLYCLFSKALVERRLLME